MHLAWATASEKNSQQFDIERNGNGNDRDFARVGTGAAAGRRRSARRYGFVDTQVPLYYRLRQVDADGSLSYSPVRSVVLSGKEATKAGLVLFPNPAHAGAATLTGAEPGTGVTVFDALGRRVTAAPADAAGTAALALPAGLPTGVYVVRVGSKALRLTVE